MSSHWCVRCAAGVPGVVSWVRVLLVGWRGGRARFGMLIIERVAMPPGVRLC
jgi:hypothetical protein